MFQTNSIFSFANARSCMILDARRESFAVDHVHLRRELVRNVASSIAESPPPTTAIMRSRKKKPSHVAHHDTPRPDSRSSPGMPILRYADPVAKMTDDASCTAPLPSFDLLDRAGQIELDDIVVEDLGTEALGLLLHLRHEIGTLDAVGEAREVLDIGGVHELAADLDRARDDERLEVRAGRVDRSGKAGRT